MATGLPAAMLSSYEIKVPKPYGFGTFFGSGRRIRTLTYGVRVRCATITQSRYVRLTNICYYTSGFAFVKNYLPIFRIFFIWTMRAVSWPMFRRRRYADGAGGKAACARSGGRPERGLAVSAGGKFAFSSDLVKMPIPFCALSCYTAYIKASERSTDHDRNEPQC